MKNQFLCIGCLAAMFALWGCGDSSSSSSDNDREDLSSEAEEVSSSSTEDESSSSIDIDIPKGARLATLDDFKDKYYSLGERYGKNIRFSVGGKHGVFALWIPDTIHVVVRSDFDNGMIQLDAEHAVPIGFMYDGKAISGAPDSLKALVSKGSSISFIVNDKDELQYSINEEDYRTLESDAVKSKGTLLSNGDSLSGKRLVCKSGDSTLVYSFYTGRYTEEVVTGKDTISWSAGYFDIQRSYLFMLPVFYNKRVAALTSGTINSEDYTFTTSSNATLPCSNEKFKYSEVKPADLVGDWASLDKKASLDWELTLSKNRGFTLSAYKGVTNVEYKVGERLPAWDVYGDVLFLKASGCLDKETCTTVIKGNITDFDKKKGFTLNHSDNDDPGLPTEWTIPVYDE